MSDCRKCADLEWCIKNEDCGLFKPKSQTNADRIRSMTDEELANFLDNYFSHWPCKDDAPIDEETEECLIPSCETCWLDWLKQEAE